MNSCPKCGHPLKRHSLIDPMNPERGRHCSTGLNEMPSCADCAERLNSLMTKRFDGGLLRLARRQAVLDPKYSGHDPYAGI